ncbi:hypothetical protein [Ferrimonas pelagia]|uniref:Primosomal replication protein PriB/PriC domain protein n=1 Tax=Ferrimonas pelagia TaxID=1177826 RepID=A0ABP9EIF7_9GAMM
MTPSDIQVMIDTYLQAEKDVLDGKQVSFGGRTLTMENLSEIRSGRKEWEARLRGTRPGSGPAQIVFN